MYWRIGVAFAVVVLAGISGYTKGYQNGKGVVKQSWDNEKRERAEEYAQSLQKALQRQQEMQASADKLRQEKDRETRDLVARNTALANSLRNRPERPTQTSAVSNPSGAGSSACTARELYREDSEVVVGIAREADEIRIALKQCYAQYNEERQSYEQRR